MYNHRCKHVSLVHSGLRLYNDRGEKLILDSPPLVAFLPPFLSGHQIEIGQKTSGGSKSVKSCPVPTPHPPNPLPVANRPIFGNFLNTNVRRPPKACPLQSSNRRKKTDMIKQKPGVRCPYGAWGSEHLACAWALVGAVEGSSTHDSLLCILLTPQSSSPPLCSLP